MILKLIKMSKESTFLEGGFFTIKYSNGIKDVFTSDNSSSKNL